MNRNNALRSLLRTSCRDFCPFRSSQTKKTLWNLFGARDTGPPKAYEGPPTPREAFGHTWSDPYRWMENADRRLSQHLSKETAHFADWAERSGLNHTFDQLYERAREYLESPVEGERTSHKERYGDWLYYTRTSAERPADHYLRAKVDGGPEQSVLDINALATNAQGPIEIGKIKISDSHNLVAYTQQSGDGVQAANIAEIESGKILDTLQNVHGIEWYRDEQHVLYTTVSHPHSLRPSQVVRHKLGTDQALDQLLLEEDRPDSFLSLNRTKDGGYISISSNSKTASEVRMIDAANPGQAPWLVHPREQDLEYFVEHYSGVLLILTTAFGGKELSLATAPVHSPCKRHWRQALPSRPDTAIEDIDVFQSHLVLWERHRGQPGFTIASLSPPANCSSGVLEFGNLRQHTFSPQAGEASIRLGANAAFDSSHIVFHASSPSTQESTAEMDLNTFQTRTTSDAWQAVLPPSVKCWREFATSADGQHVPLTLAARPESERCGRCLLRLYGAYGVPLEPEFDATLAVLLEQGWVVATAHVRGGGELGRSWHHSGRQRGKLRSLQDAEACVDHLLANGFASKGGIALQACSAGGVLAGNLLQSQPGTFCSAALRMPFLDLFTTMMDASSPLTQHEWDEWGDPRQPGGTALLNRLCPYQGIARLGPDAAANWPSVLVTVGCQDERVPAWGPAKWVAAVRRKLGGSCRVFLNAHDGGHHLPQEEELELAALEAAFLSHWFHWELETPSVQGLSRL